MTYTRLTRKLNITPQLPMMEERAAKTLKTVPIFSLTCMENKEEWKLFNYKAVSSAFCMCHQQSFLNNSSFLSMKVMKVQLSRNFSFYKRWADLPNVYSTLPWDPAFSILDTALCSMFQGLRFCGKEKANKIKIIIMFIEEAL